MKFTVTVIRTLTLEKTVHADTQEEAEQYAQAHWEDYCELLNNAFSESETHFEVEEAVEAPGTASHVHRVESTS